MSPPRSSDHQQQQQQQPPGAPPAPRLGRTNSRRATAAAAAAARTRSTHSRSPSPSPSPPTSPTLESDAAASSETSALLHRSSPPSSSSSWSNPAAPKRPSPLSHQLTHTTVSTSSSSIQTLSSQTGSLMPTPNYGTLDSSKPGLVAGSGSGADTASSRAAPPHPSESQSHSHPNRQPQLYSHSQSLGGNHHQHRRPTPRHDSSRSSLGPSDRDHPHPPRKLRSKLLFVLITTLLVICVYASFVDDFMGDVEAAISCGACIGLLVPLQALAHVGDDAFVDFFVGFCTKLGIEDADVCAGAVGTQAPILAHDLRSISLASHAAKNFCSTVFGLCPLQKTIPYSVQFLDGSNGNDTQSVLERTPMKVWRSRGRTPFQVVHLSDVHVDRSYQEGADTVCSKVICCRDYGPGSIGSAVQHPAGKFGNRHVMSVDRFETIGTSPRGLTLSYRGLFSFAPNKAFTIFTGDVVESAVWLVNEPNVTTDLHLWNRDMQHPRSPSYPVIGNHDVAPVNAFPRTTTIVPSASSSDWVFELAARDWERWIGKRAAQQVRRHYGCYSTVHPGTDLRIISLNTNYWYKQNFWLYDHDEPLWDPNGILTWLSHELHAAEKAGQRAWIIGHMPFGKVDALRDQSNYAGQIFNRYHDTIAAHFYGHSHVDEFEISYPDYNDRRAETAHGIAYISGALTPASGNPVFRVYDIDPDTYEVVDFVPYYTNKSEPSFQVEPVWKPYYSARESYGTMLIENGLTGLDEGESLNGAFWHRVTEVFEKNETAFQTFTTRLSRGGKVEDCSGSICKNNTICMLRSMRSESNCAVIQPGLSFKDQKRDTEAVTEPQRGEGEEEFAQSRQHDYFACEGPGLGSMLRKVAEGGFANARGQKGGFGVQRVKKGHLTEFEKTLKERVKMEKKRKRWAMSMGRKWWRVGK